MVDAVLRQLDRRARASDEPEDEAALLLAHLRVGRLARDRVRLAAFLGHGSAQLVLGRDAPKPIEEWQADIDAALAWLAHPGPWQMHVCRARLGEWDPFDLPQAALDACLGRRAIARLRLVLDWLGVLDRRVVPLPLGTDEDRGTNAWARSVAARVLVPWALGQGDPLVEAGCVARWVARPG